MKKTIYILAFLLAVPFCVADTFYNKISGEMYTGYATLKKDGGRTVVKTAEKGFQKLDLDDFEITPDTNGRNKVIIMIPLRDAIEFTYETDAFCEAVEKSAQQGPLLILIDVDSPGGRVDLCKRMCDKIIKTQKICPIYAFVSGGPYNGAYSAAAAVSLSCQRIYMTPDTAIGAATPYMRTQAGLKSDDEFRKTFSEYFGHLARLHDKPAPLAMGMVDKDFAVVELMIKDQRHFWSEEIKVISPKPKDAKEKEDGSFTFNIPEDSLVRTWSEKGAIVTLSAQDAQSTGIADKISDSPAQMLADLGYTDAKLKYNKAPQNARKEFIRMQQRVEKTVARAINRINNMNKGLHSRKMAINQFTKLSKELKDILGLSAKYKEIKIDRKAVLELYNQVQSILHSL